tara:strand:+ start:167 stop:520 length:354 start_codon:yes stop_codon:yes gene_type:complete
MKLFILSISMLLFASRTDTKDNSWKNGICVVQYNALFNKGNAVQSLDKISDAKSFNSWIDNDPTIKESYGVKSVPTVILYQDGKEIRRWEAGISMKLRITYRDVQHAVDEITGANQF